MIIKKVQNTCFKSSEMSTLHFDAEMFAGKGNKSEHSPTFRFSATQGWSSFFSGVKRLARTMLASASPVRVVAAANLG